MCGRLVNLDTVACVLADYYHLKTDTQLAALDEALSRVPAETVGKELFGNSEQLRSHEKDHVADPVKMVGDLISRQTAIEYFMINTNWHDEDGYPIDDSDEKRKLLEDYFNGVPSAQQNCDGCKWSDAIGYGECHHCKRAFEDMYEKGEHP